MKRSGARTGDGSRTPFVVTLLVVSLATTGLLAWQAQYAVTSHRTSAENVLRGYAALAAQEFIRRAAAEIGYGGFYPLITAFRPTAGARTLPPDLGDARLRRAGTLAKTFFAGDTSPVRIQFFGEPPAPATQAWLRDALAIPRDSKKPYWVVHAVVAGESKTAVYRRQDGGEGARAPQLVGFEVNLGALSGWLRKVLEAGPLLPEAVAHGKVGNQALFLAVRDHGGVERFRSGAEPPDGLGAEAAFGDAYGGVLEGSVVRASIDPRFAPDLVIGGLPRSRLPLLLGLLFLTAGLLVTAILQLRRERALQNLRTEFVSSVSHELRTPLAQIRMFAETLLLERVRSPEERRRYLEILNREACRLTHLVGNVLQFSRSEGHPVALTPVLQDLAPLIRDVLEAFHPIVTGTPVRLHSLLDEDVRAACDADAMHQVLLNLLDNAVKYGPRDQSVVVRLERKDGRTIVSVEDEGPGIPVRARERVFERFYRLDRDRASAVAGTGIGLAVVRDLVERQGGRAYVEAGERGGARFVVELPSPPRKDTAR